MSFDLFAIDAGAGEALLQQGEGWWLLSLEAGWQAIPLRGRADAARWSHSSRALPVGKSYDDLEQVVAEVREASLAALLPVLQSDAQRRPLLPEEASYRSPVTNERRRAEGGSLSRVAFLPGARREELIVIAAESGRLERLFERWGYPWQEVPHLVALAFEQLFTDPAGWRDDAYLPTRLFVLAHGIHLEVSGGRKLITELPNPGERQLEMLFGRRISALPPDVLEVLATWANLELGYWEIQVVLQYSPQELEHRLRRAAGAVGLAAELLRVHLFAPACRRAAEDLLARRISR